MYMSHRITGELSVSNSRWWVLTTVLLHGVLLQGLHRAGDAWQPKGALKMAL